MSNLTRQGDGGTEQRGLSDTFNQDSWALGRELALNSKHRVSTDNTPERGEGSSWYSPVRGRAAFLLALTWWGARGSLQPCGGHLGCPAGFFRPKPGCTRQRRAGCLQHLLFCRPRGTGSPSTLPAWAQSTCISSMHASGSQQTQRDAHRSVHPLHLAGRSPRFLFKEKWEDAFTLFFRTFVCRDPGGAALTFLKQDKPLFHRNLHSRTQHADSF